MNQFELGHELAIVIGAVLTGTFAIARSLLSQHKLLIERLIQLAEDTNNAATSVSGALGELTTTVREHAKLLQRTADHLNVKFTEKGN